MSDPSTVAWPASPGQRMVWALSRHRAGTGDLNVPVILRIRERADLPALQRAIDALVARHESLRTSFRRHLGRLEQVVHPPGRVQLAVTDLSGAAEPWAAAALAIHAEVQTPVDPALPALRVAIWIVGASEHVVCFTIDHLVTDAASSALIARDFSALYLGGPELPAVGWQYPQFANWQAAALDRDHKQRLMEYWRAQLAGATALNLPVMPSRDPAAPVLTMTARAALPPETISELNRVARRLRATLFVVVLAACYAALADVTGRCDLTVMSLFSERSRPEVLNTVGYFVCPLALRRRIGSDETVAELLAETRKVVFGAIEHQALSSYLLPPQWLRSESGRVDEVVVQFLPDPATLGAIEVMHRPETNGAGRTFELEIVVRPWDGVWAMTVFYAQDRFSADWIARLIAAFERAARIVTGDPQAKALAGPSLRGGPE